MKILNTLLTVMVVGTFVLSGCARETTPWKITDTDKDGIPNNYEVGTSADFIECAGESVTYYCADTDDCNCNLIPDGEDSQYIAKVQEETGCGWGCVSSNARTWIMVGSGLLGAYIAGQYFHWPFWDGEDGEKDAVTGEDVEFIDILDIYTDNQRSYLQFVKIITKDYMIFHIEGLCKYTSGARKGQEFICSYESRNQVDSISPALPSNPLTYGTYQGNLEYSYDLKKSTVEGQAEQYVKIEDMTNHESVLIKDPQWFGFKLTGVDNSRTVMTLSDPATYNTKMYYGALQFGASTPSYFQLYGPMDQLGTGTDYFYQKWLRFTP